MKFKMVYFSYPYSDNPIKRTEEIKAKVRIIMDKRSDIIPIVPHLVFDALYDFPKGYLMPEIGTMELDLIRRCDIFSISPIRSCGCGWEHNYAVLIDKPCFTLEDLLYERDKKNASSDNR